MASDVVIIQTGLITPYAFEESALDFSFPEKGNKIKIKGFFNTPPERINRMPGLCKYGLASVEIALKKSGLKKKIKEHPASCGVVISSLTGSMESDADYYAELLKKGVEYASPMKFTYTLPNIVMGEICIFYGIKGENLCVADNGSGLCAVLESYNKLKHGYCDICIAGYYEHNPKEKHGINFEDVFDVACTFILSTKAYCQKNNIKYICDIEFENQVLSGNYSKLNIILKQIYNSGNNISLKI